MRHPARIVAVAGLVSTVIVLGALPGRMHGERTAYDAYVPLRAATAEEAADLLEDAEAADSSYGKPRTWRHTAIVSLDRDFAEVATRQYLLDRPEKGSSECTWRFAERTAAGKRPVCSASWAGHAVRHRVDRRALEASLARRLGADDVDISFRDNNPVSHDTRMVPLYVLVEIIALTILLAGATLSIGRFGGAAVVPVLFVGSAAMRFGVMAYSPAHLDADNFFQRIFVEHLLWPGLLLLPVSGAALVPSLVVTWVIRRRRAAALRSAEVSPG